MPERDMLKISTRFMYNELLRQNVRTRILDANSNLLEYTDSAGNSRILFSTLSDTTSATGLTISNNKQRTKRVAVSLGIPVPDDIVSSSVDDLEPFLLKHKRIVLKPVIGRSGSGITTNITSSTSLKNAFVYAKKHGENVIAQQQVDGSDIRLLIVAGKFVSAVERKPASVIGDGVLSTRQLIEIENQSVNRSVNYMSNQNVINLEDCVRYLGTSIENVPNKGESVQVVGPANLGLGGTAHEATGLVTSDMVRHAEEISNFLQLGISGVDMIWDQDKNQYFLLEVNASPGIDMHNDPFWGTSTDALEKYVEHLMKPRLNP